MKPKYEKPTAIPLGEAAKGSGQCTAGSGVALAGSGGCYAGTSDAGNCNIGNYPYYCLPGGVAQSKCSQGNQTYNTCSYGLTPQCCCRDDPSCFNQ
jgi:hypothetical protein